MLTPTTVRPPAGSPDDPRLGSLLGTAVESGTPRAVLIGFPVDEGVRRNGGRPGAAAGPDAIRRMLYRLTPDAGDSRMAALLAGTADLGDITERDDMEAAQEQLAEAAAPYLAAGTFVLVLGGGHETALGHFRGAVRAGLQVELLNWDAHADVRPLREGRGHSGSPFRQALEHPELPAARYTVAGLQPHSLAADHLAYVRRHGRAVLADQLSPTMVRELYAVLRRPALVSFDLDAVDQAWAPGVSAPATGGLDPDRWLLAAEEAGRCPAVIGCEVVELNPSLDRDDQTARLAAVTVWRMLRGLAARPAEPG